MNETPTSWHGKPNPRSRLRSAALAIAASAIGIGVVAVAPTAADQSAGRDPLARAAHTIWVTEQVHGTNVSHEGNKFFNDRGYGTGTFNCPTLMQMRVYYTKGFISITCKMSAGEMEAAGRVAFFSAGATATFTGTIPITHGTGKYVHASGHYRVEGTEVRKTLAVQASTRGWFSY